MPKPQVQQWVATLLATSVPDNWLDSAEGCLPLNQWEQELPVVLCRAHLPLLAHFYYPVTKRVTQ